MTTTAVESTINLLCERFPKAFARFEQRRQPLKIGIHRDVLAALEVPEKDLARALRIYVSNRVYRDRLRVGVTRIDLNGNPAGVVSAEEVPTAPKGIVHLQPKAKPVKPPPTGDGGLNRANHEIKTVAVPTEPPLAAPRAPSAVASVKRMSLADLRAAAQRRKAGNTGSCAVSIFEARCRNAAGTLQGGPIPPAFSLLANPGACLG